METRNKDDFRCQIREENLCLLFGGAGICPTSSLSQTSQLTQEVVEAQNATRFHHKGSIPPDNSLPPDFCGPLREQLLPLHLSLESSESSESTPQMIAALHSAFKAADKPERERLIRYMSSDGSTLLPRLVSVIESSSEPAVVGSICTFLHDCLCPSYDAVLRKQLIRKLLLNNSAEVLLRSFRGFPAEIFSNSELGLKHGLQIVAKLASKDEKLAVKCRLVGGVKYTHQLIQVHSKNNQLLLPLLILLKFIAKNATNQVVLGKDGCVTTLISLLSSVPKTHWAKIKLILENLAILTKTTSLTPRLTAMIRSEGHKLQALLNCFFESNVIRLVRESGLTHLLCLFHCWEKIDERYQIKVLRALLLLLSYLCDSKHGRKALLALKGEEILHKFALSCPPDPRFDPLLGIALNVFLKCSSKGEQPIMALKGAVTFDLAAKDGVSPTEADPWETRAEDRESSEEEDWDGDDNYDEGHEESTTSTSNTEIELTYNPKTARIDDLLKMEEFFPEFQDENELTMSNHRHTTGSKDLVGNSGRAGESTRQESTSELYRHLSSATRSLVNFVKVAYPDMVGAEGPDYLEPLFNRSPNVIREKMLRTLDRILNRSDYEEKVVFDLDFLLESERSRQLITPTTPSVRNLNNWDEKRIGKMDITVNHLNFESRFESGNLRRAIQIAPYEYNLVLNSDVNSWHHHQWFYFEVSNMQAGIPYILNIINNEKPNSEFNFGMKPVIFSVKEALNGRSSWVRTGYDICYHKNHFTRVSKNLEDTKFRKNTGKSYHTFSMTVEFPHTNDVVYLAYHYPYTFTKLQTFLTAMDRRGVASDIFYKNQTFCHSLNGNPVPLLTITDNNKKVKEKEVVFLTARVHPGESNASWIIQGTIDFLLGPSHEARALRETYVFKIAPMINPEGVIHGNQRCGLTDEDLNRKWRNPSSVQHPTIYYTKALIEHLITVIGKRPVIFCDFHGHSRQKNVFMYGCSPQQSWFSPDREDCADNQFMTLPRLAQMQMRTFSLDDCRFDVERGRESTARVTVWRQFKVCHSFTIEASTCGCDIGPYKNYHLSPKLLLESGEEFCLTLFQFGCSDYNLDQSLTDNRLSQTGSSTSNPIEAVNEIEDSTDEFDSEDELDFELFGAVLPQSENR